MTLQAYAMTTTIDLRSASQIVSLGLGPNEVASSLVIAKYLGSLFSRSDDVRLFSILETQFHVRVRNLPPWLEGVDFERTTTMHGENMRRIRGIHVMKEVQITDLEGLSSLLVLAVAVVEPKAALVQLLEQLILGILGDVVDIGNLGKVSLPYNIKPLLQNFVQATLDSDADSVQRRRTLGWLADLASLAGPLKDYGAFKRRRQMTINLVGELFGKPSNEEKYRQEFLRDYRFGSCICRPLSKGDWSRCHRRGCPAR